eukprot:scaffold676_cov273-Pinguiococcus_pyrenoidosus.AAC.6
MAALRGEEDSLVAPEGVQKAIRERVENLPEKAVEEMHCVCALLPRHFALALSLFPQLLSRAVGLLHFDRQELNSFIKKLKGRKRREALHPELKLARKTEEDEIVPVMLRFPRFRYAELCHVPFPSQYAALYKDIQAAQFALGLVEERPNAARIGMRLCCAMDCMRDSEWPAGVKEAVEKVLLHPEEVKRQLPDVEDLPPDSSEAWMDVGPQELEELFAGYEAPVAKSAQEEAALFDEFMNASSGLDGIDFEGFNAEKFFDFLGGEGMPEEDDTDEDDGEDGDVEHSGYFDDEPTTDGRVDATAFEAEYADALLQELHTEEDLKEVVGESQNVPDDLENSSRPLNLDVEQVKQFLESARGQQAGPGAATNLFREMGIPLVPSKDAA